MTREICIDSSSGLSEPLEAQQAFWTRWNSLFIENQRGPTSQRHAQVVEGWVDQLGRRDLEPVLV